MSIWPLPKGFKSATNQMFSFYQQEILSPRLRVILSKTNWTVSKNSGNASLLTIAGVMSASFLNSIPSSTITKRGVDTVFVEISVVSVAKEVEFEGF